MAKRKRGEDSLRFRCLVPSFSPSWEVRRDPCSEESEQRRSVKASIDWQSNRKETNIDGRKNNETSVLLLPNNSPILEPQFSLLNETVHRHLERSEKIRSESDELNGGGSDGDGEVADHSNEGVGGGLLERVGRVVELDVLVKEGESVLDGEVVVEEGFGGSDEGCRIAVSSHDGEEVTSFVRDGCRGVSSNPLGDLVHDSSTERLLRPSIEAQRTSGSKVLLLEEDPALLSSLVLMDVRKDEAVEDRIGYGERTCRVEETNGLELSDVCGPNGGGVSRPRDLRTPVL